MGRFSSKSLGNDDVFSDCCRCTVDLCLFALRYSDEKENDFGMPRAIWLFAAAFVLAASFELRLLLPLPLFV